MKLSKPYLITIVGPTAIGKTALSIALAKHFSSDIVSCDSRQFFNEMSIGTAVPSEIELQAAPHHFIQNKSIHQNYNVGQYEREALPLLEKLFLQNPIQILIGGSGLYVDAILKGLDAFPEIPSDVKATVDQWFEKDGIEALQSKLQELDTSYFQKLTIENPQTLQNQQRMKRFLAVCLAENKPYSSYLNQKNHSRNFTPICIGLEADRDIMYQRIEKRVDLMMQSGLLEEAKALYPFKNNNALQTVGYRELFAYFDGEISVEEAVAEIKKNTRRFAKRQLTWFKRNPDTHWFDYQTPVNDIIQYVKTQIK